MNTQTSSQIKNERPSLWPMNIFGVNVTVRHCAYTKFTPTFARMPEIICEVMKHINILQYRKRLHLQLLQYYGTAILWARILDIKSKNGYYNLSNTENNYLNLFTNVEYNVPIPLFKYIIGVGNVGEDTMLADHTLPNIVIGGRGGYIAHTIDAENHNMWEEIPTLGIAGDVLMAMANEKNNSLPILTVIPENSEPTQNLLNYMREVGVVCEDIKMTLHSFGITPMEFHESVSSTRLNMNLVHYVSAILCKLNIPYEKVDISKLSSMACDAIMIRTLPSATENQATTRWVSAVVQCKCISNDRAKAGASYFTGYQLMKEAFGSNPLTQHQNWCCLTAAPNTSWKIPESWIENRNARRELALWYSHGNFRGMFESQTEMTETFVKKMLNRI